MNNERIIAREPHAGSFIAYLTALAAHRGLFARLVYRNLLFRYRRTFLGIAWALLQPVSLTLVVSLWFGAHYRPRAGGVPYPLFVFAGLLPWNFFSRALNSASLSLRENCGVLRRYAFPRALLPLATATGALVDLGLGIVYLGALMIFYRVAPSAHCALVPIVLCFLWLAACGIGLCLAAADMLTGDARYAFAFLGQAWFLSSPIFYSADAIRADLRGVYALNPLVGIIEGFRWAVLGDPASFVSALPSAVTATLLFAGGIVLFWRIDRFVPEKV